MQIVFGKMAILTILILPNHEHGRSFHLLRSSLISFFTDLKFLSCRYFTCLFSLTHKGVISLISVSACLSFEQRKATNLFKLSLYPATLLKLFYSFKSSLVEFLGLFKYTIISSANCDILTSSFPICIPSMSFCCRISLARTSSTRLYRYGESGQPCLFPDFSGIASSFTPFSMMLATGLLYIAFIMFRHGP